jgi:sugar/nucleoside kinase (ribokinase family)
MRRVAIFGPTSRDTVIEISEYPENGGFAQGETQVERLGGAGLNIASAVATSGVRTSFYTYVGTDEIGKDLLNNLRASKIQELYVKQLPGPSLHALITVDSRGERTIFALEKNRFSELNLNVDFTAEDIVVFPVWRNFYLPYLKAAKDKGSFIVTGLNALNEGEVTADLIVGSEKDVTSTSIDFERFNSAIITAGSKGSKILRKNEVIEFCAKNVKVIDATGAGDSFLAGILVGLAKGLALKDAGIVGRNWAAQTVQEKRSLPTSWRNEFYA